jgi:hypothetical protein
VHVDAENGLRVAFVERWRNRAAVVRHLAEPAVQSFVAAACKLAAESPQIENDLERAIAGSEAEWGHDHEYALFGDTVEIPQNRPQRPLSLRQRE